MLNLQVQ